MVSWPNVIDVGPAFATLTGCWGSVGPSYRIRSDSQTTGLPVADNLMDELWTSFGSPSSAIIYECILFVRDM